MRTARIETRAIRWPDRSGPWWVVDWRPTGYTPVRQYGHGPDAERRAALHARYRDNRRGHPTMSARNAYRWAAAVPEPGPVTDAAESLAEAVDTSHEWETADGFDVRASVSVDECPDFTYLGEWSDRWKPGAIDTEHGEPDPYSRTYRYFVPSDMAGTETEHREGLRPTVPDANGGRVPTGGIGKHAADCLAREYARFHPFRRMEAYNGSEWCYVVLSVHVSRHGVELGTAHCGGIESDGGPDYYRETLADMVAEAMAEARDTLATLAADAPTVAG